MKESWIADRMRHIDSSGIRRIFELAANLKNPIDLSIGQPDVEVAVPVQDAAIHAIRHGRNGYTQTQGIAELRNRLQSLVQQQLRHVDRTQHGDARWFVICVLSIQSKSSGTVRVRSFP